MEPDDLLAGLDAHQRAAVVTPSTLVAVIASAGSGKTRVLTRRIAYRIAAGTADARHTLALTFTREAAGELRRRLRRSGLRDPVEAGTFHSIALGLLRQRWSDTDRRPPTIVSDPQRLMAEVAGAVPLEVLAAEHDWTAARGVRAAGYAAAARQAGRRSPAPVERVAEALAAYEDEKRRRGVVDLDDLLTMVTDEAGSDAEFAETLRWRFRHVLVDEAQDLNPVQYRLLGLLAGVRRDLYLVGDPAQAIYGFNGADPTLLDDVDRHLPGIEVVRLPINHRCPPEVVAAGRRPLEVSGQRTDAVSGREPGGPIEFVVGTDEHDEADRVAGLVAACPPRLVRDGRVAVLARTHQQLTLMRRAMEARGIPCQRDPVAAGTPLAAVLRRVTGLPSPSRLRAWAHDVIDAPPDPSGTPRDDDATAEHRVALVVLDFLRDKPLGDGVGFRGWVLSTSPFNDEGDHRGVELLTFHAAKGREWPTVVVTGAETGLVPHRSATTVEGKAEEARLLHVALTRAEERLVITRAARRRGYARQASPLLAGIHDVLGTLDGPAPPVAAPAPIDAYAHDGRDERERAITLDAWRAQTARAGALLPAQICSDDDLAAIVAALPRSAAELSAVTSFGPVTAARHFDAIRAALDTVPAASP